MTQLGSGALDASTLRLGTNVFGWMVDEPAAHAVLDADSAWTLAADRGLIVAGKVRAIGASSSSAPRLAEAPAVTAA
jgi:aryl-alcohol dehydrogenase-like predicted oxidoreductase